MMHKYVVDLNLTGVNEDLEFLNVGIAGDPNIRSDGVGHLINDFIDGAKFITDGREHQYDTLSQLLNNVDMLLFHTNKNRFSLWFIAQRDLKAGEELFYSYGIEYWR